MEAHPAHNSLPAETKVEAMDMLAWFWTSNGFYLPSRTPLLRLPSHRAVPAPFTQEECQELMMLIRSFSGNLPDISTYNKYTYICDDR